MKRRLHSPLTMATFTLSLLALAGILAGNEAVAATQGSWGTTSTATAKITLHILPDAHASAPAPTAAGRDVLRRFCASSSAFQSSSPFFTASALRTSRGAAEVDELLRVSCQGSSSVAASVAKSPDRDQLTLLIAPI